MPHYRLEIVSTQASLDRAAETLAAQQTFALDIETVEWWNRQRERIALIQFAYRAGADVKVVIVDPLADCNVAALRAPLEQTGTVKIIHNAAFDAVKLFNHYRIVTAPIYDTMLAARQRGEKKYSLKWQAASHLNIHLDKSAQRSDWSRRPLDLKQIDYAARDPLATLLLYEHQLQRGAPFGASTAANYSLKEALKTSPQLALPLDGQSASRPETAAEQTAAKNAEEATLRETTPASPFARALLGIVSECPSRFGPEQLSVSVGAERVGLAGWIVDRFLGREADFDVETARIVIGELCEQGLIRLTDRRRLEATGQGNELWRQIK